MTLEHLLQPFSFCQLSDVGDQQYPDGVFFLSHTDGECSLLCETRYAPDGCIARKDGWTGLRVCGTMDFSLVGVMAGLTTALAAACVPVCAVSTFDTDYLFIQQEDAARADDALQRAGYTLIAATGKEVHPC